MTQVCIPKQCHLVLPVSELYLNGIIAYAFFSILLFPSALFLRHAPLCKRGCSAFLLRVFYGIPLHENTFIWWPTFRFGAFVSFSVVGSYKQCCWACSHIKDGVMLLHGFSLGYYLGTEIPGYRYTAFNFTAYWRSGCMNLFSHSCVNRTPITVNVSINPSY